MIKKILRKILSMIPKKTDHGKIFTTIYKNNVWGTHTDATFYSGTGSDDKNTELYTSLVSKFITDNEIKSMVDLGCGDFRVGKKIVETTGIKYIGVDVVDDLIKHHRTTHVYPNVTFDTVNIVKDQLPVAELCVIRQVLQHLSNKDIKSVINKFKDYKYVLVTEHQPNDENIIPNLNKKSDEHIRLNMNSGLYLDEPPFNKKIKTLLTVYPEAEPNSKIVTFQLLD